MNLRVLLGALVGICYNSFVGRLPSRTLRRAFLALWLAKIPRSSGVQRGCRFLNGRKTSFGENNVINFGCLFDGRKFPIRIGDNVSIGPEATILTLGHDPRSPDFSDKGGPVTIGSYAWIGFGVIILPGVTIGEGAVVGAGSVVTKDVEPYTIVAGNPATQRGTRPSDLSYKLQFGPWLG